MPAGRLGIIAGGGDLPVKLAEHAYGSGREVFVLSLIGFGDAVLAARFGGAEAALGEIGKAMKLLKEAACEEVVFAGTVKRPDLSALKMDLRGAALLPEILAVAGKGDDALLKVVLGAFEKAGFRVVGADDVLADLLAPAGSFGSREPSASDRVDLRAAAIAASQIGMADTGQGAVARGGVVIDTEKQDGTDAMLKRVADSLGSPSLGSGGVLVKRPKPQQERRIDLPTIGVATVRNAHAAGLSGVALEAGGALVLNREEVASEADRLGLFVYGFTAAEVA
jgi:DUF1009 family protein